MILQLFIYSEAKLLTMQISVAGGMVRRRRGGEGGGGARRCKVIKL